MVKFILIRHGFSEGNRSRMCTGQLDVKLTPEGYVQAQSVCDYVRENFKIDAIYSSDLCRAVDTVSPLANALGMSITLDKRFREIDTGIWTKRYFADIEAEDAERFHEFCKNMGDFKFEGGESALDVVRRTNEALAQIAESQDGRTVAVGTHAGVIRRCCAAWQGLFGEDMMKVISPSNASVTVIEYDRGEVKILEYNVDSYLSERASEIPVVK